jgi:hypothetical protein
MSHQAATKILKVAAVRMRLLRAAVMGDIPNFVAEFKSEPCSISQATTLSSGGLALDK